MLRPYSFGSRSPRPGLALSPCNDSGSSCSWRGSELDRAPPQREHPSASAPGRGVIAAAPASAPPPFRPPPGSRPSISPPPSRGRSRHYPAACSRGRGAFGVASGAVFHEWRLGLEGVLAGTSRTDGAWTAAAQGNVELLWSQPQWGVGLGAGPAGGWIANDTPVAALRLRARAWWRSSGPDLQLSIEPTHFSGAWFTDAGVGAAFERGPAMASICGTVPAVAIAGDWNRWQPVPLRSLGASLWEGTLALKRGLYPFNLLVDGSDWVVPTGVATVPDGLGGMVGVLLVP